MNELKKMVCELFEQDFHMHSIEKDIKVKTAQYHHLILKNADKVFSDEEVIAINKVCEELEELRQRKSVYQSRHNEIKDFLKKLLLPLSNGRWVHETEDPIHPRWEFWVENEELKYARLNGAGY